MELHRLHCCGIMEVHDLSSSHGGVGALHDFGRIAYDPLDVAKRRFRYALFTEASGYSDRCDRYGTSFSAFILDNKLGEVVQTGVHENPNSGNYVRAFLWTVDHEAVIKYLAVHCPEVVTTPVPPTQVVATAPDPAMPQRQPLQVNTPPIMEDWLRQYWAGREEMRARASTFLYPYMPAPPSPNEAP